jgi:hypothetical protein
MQVGLVHTDTCTNKVYWSTSRRPEPIMRVDARTQERAPPVCFYYYQPSLSSPAAPPRDRDGTICQSGDNRKKIVGINNSRIVASTVSLVLFLNNAARNGHGICSREVDRPTNLPRILGAHTAMDGSTHHPTVGTIDRRQEVCGALLRRWTDPHTRTTAMAPTTWVE